MTRCAGVSDPAVPGWDAVVERMAGARAARGGSRYIGRRLLRLLGEAGFEELDLEVTAKNTETYGLEVFLPQIDPGWLLPLVQFGLSSQEEVDALLAKRDDFLAADPAVSPPPHLHGGGSQASLRNRACLDVSHADAGLTSAASGSRCRPRY